MKIYFSALLTIITLSSPNAVGQERQGPEVAPQNGPRETYLEYIQAIRANDAKTARNWIGPGDGREDTLLGIEMLLAGNAFQDALTKRFGAEVAKRFPGQSDLQIEQLEKQVSDTETKVEILGENATISRIPEKPGPITAIGFSGDIQIEVRKYEGKWRQVPGMRAGPEEQELRKMMKEFLAVLTDLTTRIEADKVLTEEDVAKAIERFRPPRPQR